MNRKPVDHTGKRFGSWFVTGGAEKSPAGRARWLCRCDCGAEHAVLACHLVSGASTKCRACYFATNRGAAHSSFKHGQRRAGGIYRVWCNIIQRCENPNNEAYGNYGGRGITICERWRNDFAAFAADMGPRPTDRHEIDRYPDNDGPYAPGNCRWALHADNMMNTRRAIIVGFRGERTPLSLACSRAGLNYHSAKWAIYRGRPFGEIVP